MAGNVKGFSPSLLCNSPSAVIGMSSCDAKAADQFPVFQLSIDYFLCFLYKAHFEKGIITDCVCCILIIKVIYANGKPCASAFIPLSTVSDSSGGRI